MPPRDPTPRFFPPATPQTIAVDWIELPAADPESARERLLAMGFQPRRGEGAATLLHLGGLTLRVTRLPADRARPAAATITLQVTVNHARAMRDQLRDLGFKPGPVRTTGAGHLAFNCDGPAGLRIRFIGPRRDGDPSDDAWREMRRRRGSDADADVDAAPGQADDSMGNAEARDGK